MKLWTIAAVAALSLAACAQPAPAPEAPAETPIAVNVPSGEYPIDPTHTTVTLHVKHFGLSNYVLRFNTVSGMLNFNAEDPTQSTINAVVDVTSLDTPYSGDRDFDAELQNSEWLDAATYPTATFASTSVERTGPNTARVTGDLTIRGVTHPATFDVTYNQSYATHPMGFPLQLIGFSGHTTILRSQYGLTYAVPSAPGLFDGVADEVELSIEAEFVRPVPAPTAPAQ